MAVATQKACCCAPAAGDSHAAKDAVMPGAPGQTHDPVCGMVVDPVATKNLAEHGI
jgi:hypothetical protein